MVVVSYRVHGNGLTDGYLKGIGGQVDPDIEVRGIWDCRTYSVGYRVAESLRRFGRIEVKQVVSCLNVIDERKNSYIKDENKNRRNLPKRNHPCSTEATSTPPDAFQPSGHGGRC